MSDENEFCSLIKEIFKDMINLRENSINIFYNQFENKFIKNHFNNPNYIKYNPNYINNTEKYINNTENYILYDNASKNIKFKFSEKNKDVIKSKLQYFVNFMSDYVISQFYTIKYENRYSNFCIGKHMENIQKKIIDSDDPKNVNFKHYLFKMADEGFLSNVYIHIFKNIVHPYIEESDLNKYIIKGSEGNSSLKDFKARPTNAPVGVNKVFFIEKISRKGEFKERVFKPLEKEQESLIECVTGEIYRYLIGNSQPRTKTGPSQGVIQYLVKYEPIRKFLDNGIPSIEIINKFRKDLQGFMYILISSMFLEENDLHEGNFGFGPDDKLIKIDHGQSLNTLRINEGIFSKLLSVAQIKYYDKETYSEKEYSQGYKEYRSKISGRNVRYCIDENYLENFMDIFLKGSYNKDVIKNSPFRPSAFPLYDKRMLIFFKSEDLSILKEYQWSIIYKIINTETYFYKKIIYNSSERNNENLKNKIFLKFNERVNLFKKISLNTDGYKNFILDKEKVNKCNNEIKNSLERMYNTRYIKDADARIIKYM